MRTTIVLLLACCLPASAACADDTPQSRNSAPAAAQVTNAPTAEMTTVQLIDELVNVESETSGLHGTAWVRGFIAVDKPLEFGGGVIGSTAPETFPAMRELVRRGVRSIPSLIEHLADERPTRLTVGGRSFMFALFSNEYDPRTPRPQADPRALRESARLSLIEIPIPDNTYTVRVGDVCYALIGQIVNRNLLPVRYQPTAGLIINSPVKISGLIEQVKRDWDGLSTEAHEASLIADARRTRDEWMYAPALQRLRFYYPAAYRRETSGSLKETIRLFEAGEKH